MGVDAQCSCTEKVLRLPSSTELLKSTAVDRRADVARELIHDPDIPTLLSICNVHVRAARD